MSLKIGKNILNQRNEKTFPKTICFFHTQKNRAQLCLQYEKVASNGIANDEDDAKYFAKRKMLGNIKFIGELGKLQIIQDSILHRFLTYLSSFV